MVRRLITSLVLVACLLGIVQPTFACVTGASRTDCCPARSSAGAGEQLRQTAPSIEAYSCCALPTAVTPSVLGVRARPAQWHASGSPAVVDLPTGYLVDQYPSAQRRPTALVPYHADESQTYLLTARLRL